MVTSKKTKKQSKRKLAWVVSEGSTLKGLCIEVLKNSDQKGLTALQVFTFLNGNEVSPVYSYTETLWTLRVLENLEEVFVMSKEESSATDAPKFALIAK